MDIFSGNKDTDFTILAALDDKSLFSFCLADKKINRLCSDETFWRNRFVKRFGSHAAGYKPKNRTWRNHYLKVISDISTPFVFRFLSWKVTQNPENASQVYYNDIPMDKQSEKIQNKYWMTELDSEITIKFPVSVYGNTFAEKTYIQKNTPAEILKLIYNYYQENVAEEEEIEELDPVEFDFIMQKRERGEIIKRKDLLSDVTYMLRLHYLDNVFMLKMGYDLEL